jgi:hypothetical protein
MSLHRFAFNALLSALIVTALAAPANAAVTGYYVCTADASTDGGKTSTTYLSEVIPNTGFRPGQITGFREFLAQTYKINTTPRCFERSTEAQARDFMRTTSPGVNKVMTGWKFTAAGTPTPAPSPTGQVAAPQQDSSKILPGTTKAPSDALQGYCFQYTKDKLFITKTFLYNRPNGDGVDQEFSAYVSKTYGTPAYASSRCAAVRVDASRVESLRQNEISELKRYPNLQLVEFEWAPAPKPEPPAQTAAPATPAPNALDAFNKAVAAQRPASNTAPQPAPGAAPQQTARATPAPVAPKATPAPASPPSAPEVSTYSYCYAYGTPPPLNGRAAKQHFYITKSFPAATSANLNRDFAAFLTAEHPAESMNASCLSPTALDQADKGRQDAITLRRKQTTTFDVVEVDWKR